MQLENKPQMCYEHLLQTHTCACVYEWSAEDVHIPFSGLWLSTHLMLHQPHEAALPPLPPAGDSELQLPLTHTETQRFHITPTIKAHTILLALLHNGEHSALYLEVRIMSRFTFDIHFYPKQLKLDLKNTSGQSMLSRGIEPMTYCLFTPYKQI